MGAGLAKPSRLLVVAGVAASLGVAATLVALSSTGAKKTPRRINAPEHNRSEAAVLVTSVVAASHAEPSEDEDPARMLADVVSAFLACLGDHNRALEELVDLLAQTKCKLDTVSWVNARFEPIVEMNEWLEMASDENSKPWSLVIKNRSVQTDLLTKLRRLHKTFWDDSAAFDAAGAGCGG